MHHFEPNPERGEGDTPPPLNVPPFQLNQWSPSDITHAVVTLPLNNPSNCLYQILITAAVLNAASTARDSTQIGLTVIGETPFYNIFETGFFGKSSEEYATPANAKVALFFFSGVTAGGLAKGKGTLDYIFGIRERGGEVVGIIDHEGEDFWHKRCRGMGMTYSSLVGSHSELSESQSLAALYLESFGASLGDAGRALLLEAKNLEEGRDLQNVGIEVHKFLEGLKPFTGFSSFHQPEEIRTRYNDVKRIEEAIRSLALFGKLDGIPAEIAVEYDEADKRATLLLSRSQGPRLGMVLYDWNEVREDKALQEALTTQIEESPDIQWALMHAEDASQLPFPREQLDTLKMEMNAGNLTVVQSMLEPYLQPYHKFKLSEASGEALENELKKMVELAAYQPDPGGKYIVKKSESDLDCEAFFNRLSIPLINHDSLWEINPNAGTSKRIGFSFKAEHLDAFLKGFK